MARPTSRDSWRSARALARGPATRGAAAIRPACERAARNPILPHGSFIALLPGGFCPVFEIVALATRLRTIRPETMRSLIILEMEQLLALCRRDQAERRPLRGRCKVRLQRGFGFSSCAPSSPRPGVRGRPVRLVAIACSHEPFLDHVHTVRNRPAAEESVDRFQTVDAEDPDQRPKGQAIDKQGHQDESSDQRCH